VRPSLVFRTAEIIVNTKSTQRLAIRHPRPQLGVREVGEAEQVEAILNERYTNTNLKPRKQDLKRFVALVEKDPSKASLFDEYFIFELATGGWGMPKEVYLDQPFKDTGLSIYYQSLGTNANCFSLAPRYQDGDIAVARLVKFADAVGAISRLKITAASCMSNPDWPSLSSVGGGRWSSSSIDEDYTIDSLEQFLATPSVTKSRLLWNSMASLPTYPNLLQATYRRNRTWGSRTAPSQLAHHLRNAEWIPQTEGVFVRPAEACRVLLPEGFPFDAGWQWLGEIHFGVAVEKKSEEQRQKQVVAKELGFADSETLERARRFAALTPEEQERILADLERNSVTELPEHESANPDRRRRRVGEHALDAPERRSEERSRSVSVGLDAVKQEAGQYLREQYTNGDGEMICQICERRMPFTLDDDSPYFERVEFLPGLKKRHYQNYLALCPNHAAMFQYANGSADVLQSLFTKLTGNKLKVVLARNESKIYFTKTHAADLNTVVQADRTAGGKQDEELEQAVVTSDD
jgi:hypothetical protein